MARPRKPFADFAIYLVVRMLVCVVQALSWDSTLALARGIAWLTMVVDKRHRRVAEENLRHAFPHLDDVQIQRLLKASYDHIVIMALEIMRMPRLLHQRNAPTHLPFDQPEDFDRAVALAQSGRPMMLLTGHFGNWEIISYAVGLVGFRGRLVARQLDNPYLNRFVGQFRRKTGQEILDKNRDYNKILETLENKEIIGMVGDQDAGERGLFVNFLGRPASTYKSIALLSLQYSAPIMVLTAARVAHPMMYRLYLEDIIEPGDYANSSDPVREITQRYSDALERAVRRHPEQYFWLHRRWKHQPKAKRMKAAA